MACRSQSLPRLAQRKLGLSPAEGRNSARQQEAGRLLTASSLPCSARQVFTCVLINNPLPHEKPI